jgi:hypothetical protein
LTPTKEAVLMINDDLLGQLPGEVLTFHGDDSGNVNGLGHEEMTGEVMATMNCGGLPLSVLRLKIGAPVAASKFVSASWPLQRYPDDNTWYQYDNTWRDNTSRVQPDAWRCS